MSTPDLDAVARRVVRAIRSAPSEAAAVLVVRHYLRDAFALREALRFVQEHPAYPGPSLAAPLAAKGTLDALAALAALGDDDQLGGGVSADDDEPSAGDVADALARGRRDEALVELAALRATLPAHRS